jgi:hypothetical protein
MCAGMELENPGCVSCSACPCEGSKNRRLFEANLRSRRRCYAKPHLILVDRRPKLSTRSSGTVVLFCTSQNNP